MALFQTPRDRAVALILLLAIGIALALTPFFTGLLGAAVLYVIFVHPYRWLARVMKPGFAAGVILIVALAVVALPITWLIALVVQEAPDALRRVQSSDLLARLSQLRGGQLDVGAQIAASSGTIVSWLSSHVVAFAGGAASAVLNFVIAFLGLFYLLLSAPQLWPQAREYIPFSTRTADALRDRFFAVTGATLLGTVLVAVAQGTLIGFAFWLVGFSNPLFWGVVAAFASVVPVIGSTLVWLPAALILLAQTRYGAAALLVAMSAGIAGNVDSVIRPAVYKRMSNIHPMITLVGAFAGVRLLGLLGLILGPLAIAYLFELLRFYREEYGSLPEGVAASGVSAPTTNPLGRADVALVTTEAGGAGVELGS
jgi:predicted PurR-regulated permease PerM